VGAALEEKGLFVFLPRGSGRPKMHKLIAGFNHLCASFLATTVIPSQKLRLVFCGFCWTCIMKRIPSTWAYGPSIFGRVTELGETTDDG
jgi:hypothetical protein